MQQAVCERHKRIYVTTPLEEIKVFEQKKIYSDPEMCAISLAVSEHM